MKTVGSEKIIVKFIKSTQQICVQYKNYVWTNIIDCNLLIPIFKTEKREKISPNGIIYTDYILQGIHVFYPLKNLFYIKNNLLCIKECDISKTIKENEITLNTTAVNPDIGMAAVYSRTEQIYEELPDLNYLEAVTKAFLLKKEKTTSNELTREVLEYIEEVAADLFALRYSLEELPHVFFKLNEEKRKLKSFYKTTKELNTVNNFFISIALLFSWAHNPKIFAELIENKRLSNQFLKAINKKPHEFELFLKETTDLNTFWESLYKKEIKNPKIIKIVGDSGCTIKNNVVKINAENKKGSFVTVTFEETAPSNEVLEWVENYNTLVKETLNLRAHPYFLKWVENAFAWKKIRGKLITQRKITIILPDYASYTVNLDFMLNEMLKLRKLILNTSVNLIVDIVFYNLKTLELTTKTKIITNE